LHEVLHQLKELGGRLTPFVGPDYFIISLKAQPQGGEENKRKKFVIANQIHCVQDDPVFLSQIKLQIVWCSKLKSPPNILPNNALFRVCPILLECRK
jgi:hypothetical protein